VYVPAVISVIPIGVVVFVPVLAELEVVVNTVTVSPPVAFAVNGTETTPDVPPEAVPIVGACGTVVAVMLLDAADAADVPIEFVAVAVNVYSTPDCKPVTTSGDEAPEAEKPPGLDVTVYEVIGILPSKTGAVKVTEACPLL
jgi:hypothetical protein